MGRLIQRCVRLGDKKRERISAQGRRGPSYSNSLSPLRSRQLVRTIRQILSDQQDTRKLQSRCGLFRTSEPSPANCIPVDRGLNRWYVEKRAFVEVVPEILVEDYGFRISWRAGDTVPSVVEWMRTVKPAWTADNLGRRGMTIRAPTQSNTESTHLDLSRMLTAPKLSAHSSQGGVMFALLNTGSNMTCGEESEGFLGSVRR
ncbi:uncharacterized protein HMPREF1120_05216 [Exophiala dermatitidis NIH/UT8656]|uniref:Uncharacterized protein n=1 Tax=Exophiala dermatitidis (strain ATCC 34100 / CBS 525.76 / NIH/UT8656) TaxID=858893 RepID=H6C019_EXODN|nr:uncharacterized protein HMPREF1120_05216 [Exophiala dermatitidis NIH/UT8656]EHY57168.1 hypothetical protein HMPREF1120_05216 [Exophiala dermatitidis NIH/UT8656]